MKNNTFGNSDAAATLDNLLVSNTYMNRKVSRIIHVFNFNLNELRKIDDNLALRLSQSLLHDTKENSKKIDNSISRYLIGVINYNYAKWVKEIEQRKKKK